MVGVSEWVGCYRVEWMRDMRGEDSGISGRRVELW